jgi:ETS-type family
LLDPLAWETRDVQAWLKWTSQKFSLENLNPKIFPQNGQDLCKLSRDDFADLTGDAKSGRILATHLAHLRGDPDGSSQTFDPPKSSQPTKQTSYSSSAYLSHDQGKIWDRQIDFSKITLT